MSSKQLLIVDDSRVSRMMIRSLIARLRPDWQVREAANADEAFLALDEGLPDYIIMDINMPGMLGTEAAARIRGEHPGMPIALFSANVQSAQMKRAAALGIVLVGKPVSERTVLQVIAYFEQGV